LQSAWDCQFIHSRRILFSNRGRPESDTHSRRTDPEAFGSGKAADDLIL
jgi:hypothetical protein